MKSGNTVVMLVLAIVCLTGSAFLTKGKSEGAGPKKTVNPMRSVASVRQEKTERAPERQSVIPRRATTTRSYEEVYASTSEKLENEYGLCVWPPSECYLSKYSFHYDDTKEQLETYIGGRKYQLKHKWHNPVIHESVSLASMKLAMRDPENASTYHRDALTHFQIALHLWQGIAEEGRWEKLVIKRIAVVQFFKGRVLHKLGQIEEARECYQKARTYDEIRLMVDLATEQMK